MAHTPAKNKRSRSVGSPTSSPNPRNKKKPRSLTREFTDITQGEKVPTRVSKPVKTPEVYLSSSASESSEEIEDEKQTKRRRASGPVGDRSWVWLLLDGPYTTPGGRTYLRCKLSKYAGMCRGKHKDEIAYNPASNTSNYRHHFEKHHKDVFDAMEKAKLDGESFKQALATLLSKKSYTLPQQTLNLLWKNGTERHSCTFWER